VRPYLKKITKSKRGLEAWGSSRVQAWGREYWKKI
jgi:hypothetical protein